jgi:hypothetical protein
VSGIFKKCAAWLCVYDVSMAECDNRSLSVSALHTLDTVKIRGAGNKLFFRKMYTGGAAGFTETFPIGGNGR